MQTDAASRRLTSISSVIALVFSLTTLLIVQTCLPKASSQVANHFSFYAVFSALVSGAGIFGARRRHAIFISIFANYLLLDAIVFTIPRLILVVYTIAVPNTICGHTAGAVTPDQVAFRSAPVYSNRHPRQLARLEGWAGRVTSLSHGHCLAVSGVVDGFFVVLVLGVTVAEWWCALRIRRYAANLARESELLDEKRDDERNGHRKSSSLSSLSPV